jgi:twitching motility protein PilT
MFNTPAIANLLRSQKPEQISSIIQTSSRDGMITFNRAIEELLMTGQITPEVAKMYARGESGDSYWR